MRHTHGKFRLVFQSQANKPRNDACRERASLSLSLWQGKHFGRKYGWTVSTERMNQRNESSIYVCIAHLYFILLYTQPIRNTDLRLFVIPCTQAVNGWMHGKWRVCCKHTHTHTHQQMWELLSLRRGRWWWRLRLWRRQQMRTKTTRNQARKAADNSWIYVCVWGPCEIKIGILQRWVWELVTRRIRNKAIAMHRSW